MKDLLKSHGIEVYLVFPNRFKFIHMTVISLLFKNTRQLKYIQLHSFNEALIYVHYSKHSQRSQQAWQGLNLHSMRLKPRIGIHLLGQKGWPSNRWETTSVTKECFHPWNSSVSNRRTNCCNIQYAYNHPSTCSKRSHTTGSAINNGTVFDLSKK